MRRTVLILLFDEVEVLDFAGPFEVFSVTGRNRDEKLFEVMTCAEKSPILARNGLSVNVTHSLENAPKADLLVVPGGWGTRAAMKSSAMVNWVQQRAEQAELVLSVCTGSLILGAAGLLDGREATTHHAALEVLRTTAVRAKVREDLRVVDTGKVITSGGISAGIDMAFHVVARLLGEEEARETARYMEYRWP
jgi:transcriptional regulator GlxA family with amidase domain